MYGLPKGLYLSAYNQRKSEWCKEDRTMTTYLLPDALSKYLHPNRSANDNQQIEIQQDQSFAYQYWRPISHRDWKQNVLKFIIQIRQNVKIIIC